MSIMSVPILQQHMWFGSQLTRCNSGKMEKMENCHNNPVSHQNVSQLRWSTAQNFAISVNIGGCTQNARRIGTLGYTCIAYFM